MTSTLARHHVQLVIALIIIIPVLLAVMHVKFGDFWPAVIMLGGAALMVFAFSRAALPGLLRRLRRPLQPAADEQSGPVGDRPDIRPALGPGPRLQGAAGRQAGRHRNPPGFPEAAMTNTVARHHVQLVIALIIIIPVLLWVVHVRFGEFREYLTALATAAFMVFVVPHVPFSPVSCFASGAGCSQEQAGNQAAWALGLFSLVPLIMLSVVRERRKGWLRKRGRQ